MKSNLLGHVVVGSVIMTLQFSIILLNFQVFFIENSIITSFTSKLFQSFTISINIRSNITFLIYSLYKR